MKQLLLNKEETLANKMLPFLFRLLAQNTIFPCYVKKRRRQEINIFIGEKLTESSSVYSVSGANKFSIKHLSKTQSDS